MRIKVCASSQHTSGHQGEKNHLTVTSVCHCLFKYAPRPLPPPSLRHIFSCLVANSTSLLHCHWHDYTVAVLSPFILINTWVSSRSPYQPRRDHSVVNLIDVCSLDLGHWLLAVHHGSTPLPASWYCCCVIVLLSQLRLGATQCLLKCSHSTSQVHLFNIIQWQETLCFNLQTFYLLLLLKLSLFVLSIHDGEKLKCTFVLYCSPDCDHLKLIHLSNVKHEIQLL